MEALLTVLVWLPGIATEGVEMVEVAQVEVVMGCEEASWVMVAAEPRLADPRDIMLDALPHTICTCCTCPLGSRICAS